MIGNFVNGSGGAIALKAGASLVMNGGSIVGNVASNTFGSLGHGGAFMSLVGAVNISLTGVVVKDNYANASGGLAYLNGDSTLTLSGCTLANNTAMGGCNCVYRNGTNPGCDTSFCS